MREMKKTIAYLQIIVLCMSLLSFGTIEAKNQTKKQLKTQSKENEKVNIKIGNKSFNAILYNNKTVDMLKEKLPINMNMSELNGNEKYKYLNYGILKKEEKVKKIKAGDIMLYGNRCLVIFYKSFNTTYKYTRIGKITNTKGLKKAVGKGNVKVSFLKKEGVYLSAKNVVLFPGQTMQLSLNGAKANKVKWSSKNKRTVKVSKGTITARKEGITNIIAKYKNKKYKCKVTVKKGTNNNINSKTNASLETAKPTVETEGAEGSSWKCHN